MTKNERAKAAAIARWSKVEKKPKTTPVMVTLEARAMLQELPRGMRVAIASEAIIRACRDAKEAENA